ncbi:unnamed protein product [Rotaria sp. Silwood1]|nr:unnamed protein product [Rotaria sp. Silwood1]
MSVLRYANVSIFININDLDRIGSPSLFTDHRHVDVHFVFNLINCPQYINVSQYIPRVNCFHRREIVGATLLVNNWSDRSEWLNDGDLFSHGHQYYHHM